MNWLPIASAWKDGARMHLFVPGPLHEPAKGHLLGWYDSNRKTFVAGVPGYEENAVPINPTHWAEILMDDDPT